VRKIIEMHGGTVSAQSRLNAGTTMTIRLPRPGEMAK
jgi:signal transduction histidine kinase